MSGVRYSPKLRARVMAGDEPAWLLKHPRRAYILAALRGRVPWADQKAIAKIYRDARRRGLVVDHDIPLCHRYVCGLTVPNNLRAIPRLCNAAKSNVWMPDQIDAFPRDPEPHQLRIA
jgi:hypothetical protein